MCIARATVISISACRKITKNLFVEVVRQFIITIFRKKFIRI